MLPEMEVSSVWPRRMCRRRHGLRCVPLLQLGRPQSTRTPHSWADGVEWLPYLLPRAGFLTRITHVGQHDSINWTQQAHGLPNIDQLPAKVTVNFEFLNLIWSVKVNLYTETEFTMNQYCIVYFFTASEVTTEGGIEMRLLLLLLFIINHNVNVGLYV